MSAPYNYEHFPLDLCQPDFAAFPTVLRAGGPAPDGELTDAATGARVRLSDHWRKGPLVLEFGSLT
jgi:hypothetical protein